MLPVRHGLVVLVAAVFSGSALAAGNAENGRIVAGLWCTSCHAVGRDATASDAAPAFTALARERSPEQLRGWLSEPHPPMPNLSLTRFEVEDIVAYLQSLSPRR
jgi:mono/diheme cytochrome c family protein